MVCMKARFLFFTILSFNVDFVRNRMENQNENTNNPINAIIEHICDR